MTTTDSKFRAPRVTTYASQSGGIHAVDTGTPASFRHGRTVVRMVCGRELTYGLFMRSSDTADAYVTCDRCARRLADGITVSDATVRRARLAAQLNDQHA